MPRYAAHLRGIMFRATVAVPLRRADGQHEEHEGPKGTKEATKAVGPGLSPVAALE